MRSTPGKRSKGRKNSEELVCRFCGRELKSRSGKIMHEKHCPERDVETLPEELEESPREVELAIEELKGVAGQLEGLAEPVQFERFDEEEAEVERLVEEMVAPPPEVDLTDLLEPAIEMSREIAKLRKDLEEQRRQLRSERYLMEEERERWREEQERAEELARVEIPTEPEKVAAPSEAVERLEERSLLEDLRHEIDQIRESLEGKLELHAWEEMASWRDQIVKKLDELDDKSATLTTVLTELTARMTKRFEELRELIEVKADTGELRRLQKELARVSEKLEEVVEEAGIGEALDVSKIPPNILEIVYQATLDDVVRELRRSLGPEDTERVIQEAREEVRLRTSGTELFRFKPPDLIVEDLAVSIQKGLISAKQVQMTYEELLRKLIEPIPHYKPKNFKAMIKLKSQEFAVDRGTRLWERFEELEPYVIGFENSLKELSRTAEERAKALEEEISKLNQIEAREEMMKSRLEEMEEILKSFREEQTSIRERVDELSKTFEELRKAPSPAAKVEAPSDEEILSAIPAKGATRLRIAKATGVEGELLQERLDALTKSGKLRTEKRGRWTVYIPSEEEAIVAEEAEERAEMPVEERAEVKTLEELNEIERKVLETISEETPTLNRIRKELADEMKYTDVLKALKVLLDSGHVTVTTRGRHTIYQRVKKKEAEKDA